MKLPGDNSLSHEPKEIRIISAILFNGCYEESIIPIKEPFIHILLYILLLTETICQVLSLIYSYTGRR